MSTLLYAFIAASLVFTFFVLAACRVSGRCAQEEGDIDTAGLECDLTEFVKHLNGKDAA